MSRAQVDSGGLRQRKKLNFLLPSLSESFHEEEEKGKKKFDRKFQLGMRRRRMSLISLSLADEFQSF